MKKILYSFVVITFIFAPIGVSNSSYSSDVFQTVKLSFEKNEALAQGCPITDPECARAAREAGANGSKNEGGCAWYELDCQISRLIATVLITLGGVLVYIAGILFNYAILETVVNMSTNIDKMAALNIGWSTFRDVANIFFIFILLWIGVSTILNLKSHATMQMLVKIIIVALLINFSLFFTKIFIDASNIVSLQFYNGMASSNASADPLNSGISWAFVKPLGLITYFNTDSVPAAGGTNEVGQAAVNEYLTALGDNTNFLMVGVMGFIFMVITAFVFFAASILLVIRFAILVFLMITAPLAYVGSIFPKGGEFSTKWWNALFEQCVFAPVLMMFLWFTAVVINSKAFTAVITGYNQTGDPSIAAAISSGSASAVGVVLNFLIIITFMIASLIVAKNAGAVGGGWAVKGVKAVAGGASLGAGGWLLRRTAGAGSYALAERLKDTRFATTRLGSATLRGVRGVAGSSFDARAISGADLGLGKASGKGGFTEIRKQEIKTREDYSKSLGKTPIIQKEAQEAYKEKQKAVEAAKGEVAKLDTQIADAMRRGESPAELIKQRNTARTDLGKAESIVKEFETNKNLGTTKQAAYAAGLAGEGRFGGKASAGTRAANILSWITFRHGAQKASAKKIREGMKKDPNKALLKALKDAEKAEGGEEEKKEGETKGGGEGEKKEGEEKKET